MVVTELRAISLLNRAESRSCLLGAHVHTQQDLPQSQTWRWPKARWPGGRRELTEEKRAVEQKTAEIRR